MNRDVLVVAPHPDDETLGCGGSLLRHRREGDRIHWLIATSMGNGDYPSDRLAQRQAEIEAVAKAFEFTSVHQLGLPAAGVDSVPRANLVRAIGSVFRVVNPAVVYLPYAGDSHSDHATVFHAAASCTKWFRYGSITQVLVYETLSETDSGIDPDSRGFRPQLFVDISGELEEKLRIMAIYRSEMEDFPFPRSVEGIRALATLRGVAMGARAAEAFMVLKERLRAREA
ncbi:MAG: PIG-L deacetylase family protein [Gemmatimonadaceae bacterium]